MQSIMLHFATLSTKMILLVHTQILDTLFQGKNYCKRGNEKGNLML